MESKKYPTLITEYARKMDMETPWNEYPRPSMVRDSFLCLNGKWDFAVTEGDAAPEYKEKILVPFPPESLLSGLEIEIPEGSLMHYRRSFSLPFDFNTGRVILHFGAVDTICDVYLNGKRVMHHEGGYLPFSADVTDALTEGENELYLKVKDSCQRNMADGMGGACTGGLY